MEVSDGIRKEVKGQRYHGHWRVGSYFHHRFSMVLGLRTGRT